MAGGNGVVAGGSGSVADGKGPVACGSSLTAGGNGATAEGSGAVADGKGPTADGNGATAGGNALTAGGSGATAGGNGVVAGGSGPTADGSGVVARGRIPKGGWVRKGGIGLASWALASAAVSRRMHTSKDAKTAGALRTARWIFINPPVSPLIMPCLSNTSADLIPPAKQRQETRKEGIERIEQIEPGEFLSRPKHSKTLDRLMGNSLFYW